MVNGILDLFIWLLGHAVNNWIDLQNATRKVNIKDEKDDRPKTINFDLRSVKMLLSRPVFLIHTKESRKQYFYTYEAFDYSLFKFVSSIFSCASVEYIVLLSLWY